MVQKTSVLRATFHTLVSRWRIAELYHQLAQNSYQSVTWLTLLFTVASAVSPSNKLFFVLATAYVLAVLYVTHSIYKTFFFVFVPLSLLNIGQIYTITVIPFAAIKNLAGYEGRQLYFHFSPFFVVLLTSISLLVVELIRHKGRVKLGFTHLFLLASILMSLISVFHTEQFPLYSLSIVTFLLGYFCWTTITQLFLDESSSLEKIKCIKTFFFVVFVMVNIELAITIGQYFKRNTLNLRIEQSTVIPIFGLGADENGAQFRPIGLQTHANELANTSLITLFTGLLLLQWLKKQKEDIPWWLVFSFTGELLLSILITQSRAAYLGLTVAVLFFFFYQRKTSLEIIQFVQKKLQPYLILLALAAFFFVPIVSDRLLYSLNSFGTGGGFSTRYELEQQAFLLLKDSPFLGVGPGMFIGAAFKENPLGIIHYFPENVHNGVILFLTENGIFSSLFLAGFFYFLIKRLAQSTLDAQERAIGYAGLLGIVPMIMLHPFENFFCLFVLILWVMVYIQQGK